MLLAELERNAPEVACLKETWSVSSFELFVLGLAKIDAAWALLSKVAGVLPCVV